MARPGFKPGWGRQTFPGRFDSCCLPPILLLTLCCCWRWGEFFCRPVVAGRVTVGLRLRSGAFAPDFPFVIVVQAFGLPFRFPRAQSKRPTVTRPATTGLLMCWVVALLNLDRTVCLCGDWRKGFYFGGGGALRRLFVGRRFRWVDLGAQHLGDDAGDVFCFPVQGAQVPVAGGAAAVDQVVGGEAGGVPFF